MRLSYKSTEHLDPTWRLASEAHELSGCGQKPLLSAPLSAVTLPEAGWLLAAPG